MGSGCLHPFHCDQRKTKRNDGSCRRRSRRDANRYEGGDGRHDGWQRNDGPRWGHDEPRYDEGHDGTITMAVSFTSRELSKKYDQFARWYDLVEGVPNLLGVRKLRRRLLR